MNKAQDAPKSKKVQHANAKNAVLFEAIALIIHHDSEPSLLVRACNQLGTFLSHRETNLRYNLRIDSSRLMKINILEIAFTPGLSGLDAYVLDTASLPKNLKQMPVIR